MLHHGQPLVGSLHPPDDGGRTKLLGKSVIEGPVPGLWDRSCCGVPDVKPPIGVPAQD